MTRAAECQRREGGFTLIEVIVALAIMGLLLGALFQAFGGGLNRLSRSDAEQRASLMASALIEEGLRLPAEEIDASGAEGRFRWQRRTNVLRAEDLEATDLEDWEILEVEVEVSWGEDGALRFATLRLEPR